MRRRPPVEPPSAKIKAIHLMQGSKIHTRLLNPHVPRPCLPAETAEGCQHPPHHQLPDLAEVQLAGNQNQLQESTNADFGFADSEIQQGTSKEAGGEAEHLLTISGPESVEGGWCLRPYRMLWHFRTRNEGNVAGRIQMRTEKGKISE